MKQLVLCISCEGRGGYDTGYRDPLTGYWDLEPCKDCLGEGKVDPDDPEWRHRVGACDGVEGCVICWQREPVEEKVQCTTS